MSEDSSKNRGHSTIPPGAILSRGAPDYSP